MLNKCFHWYDCACRICKKQATGECELVDWSLCLMNGEDKCVRFRPDCAQFELANFKERSQIQQRIDTSRYLLTSRQRNQRLAKMGILIPPCGKDCTECESHDLVEKNKKSSTKYYKISELPIDLE